VRVLLAVLALVTAASADVTRPAYLGVTETLPGRFDVVWRVPRRGDRVLAIRARLPGVFRETAPPTVEIEPGVQITRWSVQAEPWELPGSVITVEGPGAARVDTMVRFEFKDGTVVARILPPGRTMCQFPRRESARSPAREISEATLVGFRHAFLFGAHLVFVIGLALCGRARVVARALALFLVGQLVGVAAGLPIPAPAVHALLAVAGVVAARLSLRSERRRPRASRSRRASPRPSRPPGRASLRGGARTAPGCPA
jgi:hypothetical protein